MPFFRFFLALLCFTTYAQSQHFSQEIDFVTHLMNEGEYRDAIYVLHQLEKNDTSYNRLQKDSLYYRLGWSYYNLQSLDTSITYFEKVSDSFHAYTSAKFYQSFNNSYLGNHQRGRQLLHQLSLENRTELQQLKYLELAGIALLDRQYNQFQDLSHQFNYKYPALNKKQERLQEHFESLKGIRDKSPFLAGVMSAVVPGSGKWYAGNPWKGLSSFLTVSTLGAVATENYLKGGPKSAQFIATASVFTIFYVGNIWGSVLSVNVTKRERYAEVDRQIKLDMHIPLRRVFD